MTAESFELRGNLQGLSESEIVTLDSDGELHIIYEANRCASAWVEILTDNGVTVKKLPFIGVKPSDAFKNFKKNTRCKIVASIPPSGSLTVTLTSG